MYKTLTIKKLILILAIFPCTFGASKSPYSSVETLVGAKRHLLQNSQMDNAEQNYTKQEARSSHVKPGFIRLDIFPGKQAREIYWALSIQKDALLETAAVNLANEDLDGYFEHLYEASELGETIDDLVLGIIDALDPTERDNTLSLSRRQQMKEDLSKRIFKTSPSSLDTSAELSPN